MSTFKLGIILPLGEGRMEGQTARWADLLAMTRATEELGFDSLWFVDHLLVQNAAEGTRGVWECWSLLSPARVSAIRRC